MSLVVDTFTDTDGVLLQAHTSDSSHTWTKSSESDASTSFTIHSDTAWIPVVGVLESAYVNITMPSPDYSVSMVGNTGTVAGTATFPNIYGRWNTTDTRYKLDFRVDASTNGVASFVLSKDVAGVNTILHTFNVTTQIGTITMQLDMVGNQITATVGGTAILTGAGNATVTDSSITTAGKPGIAAFDTNTLSNWAGAQYFNSFQVDDLTGTGGGGSTDNVRMLRRRRR